MTRKILAYFYTALLIGLVASTPAMAVNLFSENFESGVSGSIWTLVNAGQRLVDGDTGGHHLGLQSAKQVNACIYGVSDVYYMKTQSTEFTNPGPIAAGTKEVATVMFWDDNIRTDQSGNSAIDIRGALMLANSSTLDFYQLGVNSSVSVNNYFWRTQAQGSFATSVARTQGVARAPYRGPCPTREQTTSSSTLTACWLVR